MRRSTQRISEIHLALPWLSYRIRPSTPCHCIQSQNRLPAAFFSVRSYAGPCLVQASCQSESTPRRSHQLHFYLLLPLLKMWHSSQGTLHRPPRTHAASQSTCREIWRASSPPDPPWSITRIQYLRWCRISTRWEIKLVWHRGSHKIAVCSRPVSAFNCTWTDLAERPCSPIPSIYSFLNYI